MLDLQGPKIRLGEMKKGVALESGDIFALGVKPCVGTKEKASVGYAAFIDDVAVGDVVFIDDGKLRLKAIAKEADHVQCQV
eukprot:COSAG01_NODE_69017_length_262_cov_1.257669_1_plen_80_part_01